MVSVRKRGKVYEYRLETETDSTKMIPFDKLVKLSIILDKDIDEFLK